MKRITKLIAATICACTGLAGFRATASAHVDLIQGTVTAVSAFGYEIGVDGKTYKVTGGKQLQNTLSGIHVGDRVQLTLGGQTARGTPTVVNVQALGHGN
jgi:hypothetical protein